MIGFSFSGSAPNQGLIFTLLKPFDERQRPEQRIQGLLPSIRGQLFGIQGGIVIPFAPPGINIGNLGGFSLEVLDQGGAADIQNLGNAVQALLGASRQSTQVAGLFSAFTANDPQLAVDIDREKARSLGLPISEITSAMLDECRYSYNGMEQLLGWRFARELQRAAYKRADVEPLFGGIEGAR